MTVLSLKSPWINNDGLPVYSPADAGTVTRGGEVDFDGRHQTRVSIDLTTIAAYNSSNQTIVAEHIVIPKGAFIEQVDVFVTKETTGSNANLDLGLVKLDRTTELDFNGFLTAGDDFNGGTDLGATYSYKAPISATDGGALIGTVLTSSGLITANAETANWSAGIIQVRIFWSIPLTADV